MRPDFDIANNPRAHTVPTVTSTPIQREPKASARPRRGEARDALMQAALELVATEANFSALSLRHVARQAGVVPTAFYRHFEDMDALGLALIEDSFTALRQILRDADISSLPFRGLVRHSVAFFARHVHDNRLPFQFVVKERFSGSLLMREAIHHQVGLLTHDLATDLRRFEQFRRIDDADLNMVAELVISTLISLSEDILEVAPSDEQTDALMHRCEQQLRLIFMGAGQWRSTRRNG